ncbi:unnamed protein product [Diatraea saccharalis]|uniref:YqaJ viral recombinase domain-containing protein n=1 Tax=Diatraea saccharalis TaxID=40085 RepID=A0A9N9WHI6_9NEOP|nr:unnamed protein product [Diatraea saccharalis]
MESGFIKANSGNLPKIDSLMVANFFATNKDFCASELRNVKISLSSRESYGDDAVGYVQLKRESNICTVKCRVCPEHKVRVKPYTVTVVVDEKNSIVKSTQCHDCAASAGGCKHGVAFLMWLHRRSEEPSCTEVACYWKKSMLSKVGTTLKYITAAELAKGHASTSSDPHVVEKFVEQLTAKGNSNCELLKYVQNTTNEMEGLSLYHLVQKYKEKCSEDFIKKVLGLFTPALLEKIEEVTRDQSSSSLWHELRFGRITASKAYEVKKCKTRDGALISLIMGGTIPETPAIKRGRILENKVRGTVEKILKKKIRRCGLFISQQFPMIAGSPDGIGEQFLIEIKCPFNENTIKNYIQNGKPSSKCYDQMQIQMYVCGYKKCFFCIADINFQSNNKVNIISVDYNEEYVETLLQSLLLFWKTNIYPLLYKTTET